MTIHFKIYSSFTTLLSFFFIKKKTKLVQQLTTEGNNIVQSKLNKYILTHKKN